MDFFGVEVGSAVGFDAFFFEQIIAGILHEELADDWLVRLEGDKDEKFIKDLIQEYPEEELDAYPVGKLRGKDSLGNVPGISDRVEYAGLVV